MNDNACPHVRDALRIKTLVQDMADDVADRQLRPGTATPAMYRAIALGILAERKRVAKILVTYRAERLLQGETRPRPDIYNACAAAADDLLFFVMALNGAEEEFAAWLERVATSRRADAGAGIVMKHTNIAGQS